MIDWICSSRFTPLNICVKFWSFLLCFNDSSFLYHLVLTCNKYFQHIRATLFFLRYKLFVIKSNKCFLIKTLPLLFYLSKPNRTEYFQSNRNYRTDTFRRFSFVLKQVQLQSFLFKNIYFNNLQASKYNRNTAYSYNI